LSVSSWSGIVPEPEEATMMMGALRDTGCLPFNSTTTRDYEAAAFLHAHGATLDRRRVSHAEADGRPVALLHGVHSSRTVLNLRIDISIARLS
jgi:tRNA nucleotidyltransferase (CCA-adding enzyme)